MAPDKRYEVHVVPIAPAALATLESFAADVVVAHPSALSDPRFVGRLVGRLRRRPALRHTKLLLVADGAPVSKPMSAAAHQIINAPVDQAWLLARVDAAVAASAAGSATADAGQPPPRREAGRRETWRARCLLPRASR